tara:strand:+ start:11377 stop:12801 length:1425 start_codon:yes stop_codon:yes gene_type:complete
MNRLIYLFILLPCLSFSQISVTSNNLPNIGDTAIVSGDYSGTFTAGSPGANQNWDFSTATGTPEMMLGFIDPSTTPYQGAFPNSNIAVKDDLTFFYLNRSVNGLAMMGIVDSGTIFSWQKVMLPAPLNYLDTLIYTNIMGQMDTVLSPAIPSVFLDIPGPYLVDSIVVTFESVNEFIVDGWGQVQMPNSTYDALRIFETLYNSESYLVRLTDTITGQSQWTQTPSDMEWEESRYLWRTNDPSVNWSLVEMETDSLGNSSFGDIQYYAGNSINSIVISPPIVDINKLADISCNGAADGLIMLDVYGTAIPFVFSWFGPSGFSSTSQDIFNLEPGIYEVTITDANGASITETYTISEPPLLTASINQPLLDLVVMASGGTPPYSYIWNPGIAGDTLATITPVSNGIYTCEITDKLECITTVTFNVTNVITDIRNIKHEKKKSAIIDLIGKRNKGEKGSVLLYIFEDGTVEKRIFLE